VGLTVLHNLILAQVYLHSLMENLILAEVYFSLEILPTKISILQFRDCTFVCSRKKILKNLNSVETHGQKSTVRSYESTVVVRGNFMYMNVAKILAAVSTRLGWRWVEILTTAGKWGL